MKINIYFHDKKYFFHENNSAIKIMLGCNSLFNCTYVS